MMTKEEQKHWLRVGKKTRKVDEYNTKLFLREQSWFDVYWDIFTVEIKKKRNNQTSACPRAFSV